MRKKKKTSTLWEVYLHLILGQYSDLGIHLQLLLLLCLSNGMLNILKHYFSSSLYLQNLFLCLKGHQQLSLGNSKAKAVFFLYLWCKILVLRCNA